MTKIYRVGLSLLLACVAGGGVRARADEAPYIVSSGFGWQTQSTSSGASGLDAHTSTMSGGLSATDSGLSNGAPSGSMIYAQLQQALQSTQAAGNMSGITPDQSQYNGGALGQPGFGAGMTQPGGGQFGMGTGMPQPGTGQFGMGTALEQSGVGQTGIGNGMTQPGTGQFGSGTALEQSGVGQTGIGSGMTQYGLGQSGQGAGLAQTGAPGYATAGDANGVMQSVFGNLNGGSPNNGANPGFTGGVQSGLMPDGAMPNGAMSGATMPNGIMPNGAMQNGMMPNGITPNAAMPNGMTPNGTSPYGATPNSGLQTGIIQLPPNPFAHSDPKPRENESSMRDPSGRSASPAHKNAVERPNALGHSSDSATIDSDSNSQSRSSSSNDNSPLKQALGCLQNKNFDACISKLDAVLQTDPRNAQAHYLKAVAFVMTRHYSRAADEYRATLQHSTSTELSRLAETGLAKLSR